MFRSEVVVAGSAPASRTHHWISARALVAPLVVAVAYYIGCLAGFALRFPSSGISFFWPPTAVLTAALLVRPGAWPGILLAALVAHGMAHGRDGVPATAWLVQFLGNGSQAALAAFVVHRYSRTRLLLADTRSVLVFVTGACIIAPALASLVPASVYVRLGWAGDFRDAWLARTVTNAVASMTLVPPLVVSCQLLAANVRLVPRRVAEFALLLLGIAVVHIAADYAMPGGVLGLSLALYAPAPFLLWAIVRFGVPGLSYALVWTTLLTIAAASVGRGPIIALTPPNTVLGVQIFVCANAVFMMLIASLLEEHRAEHARLIEVGNEKSALLGALSEAQQRYQLATAAGGIGMWDYDIQTGAVYTEGNLKALLGYREDEIDDTLAGWIRHVWLADRGEVQSRLLGFASGAIDSYDIEFRMSNRDGSWRWIASQGTITKVDGAAARVTGTYADVTQRKESERALREATDALARTWRISAMAELSGSLAHELKQPLTAIVANANACARWIDAGASVTDIKDALDDVLQESRRATQIIERTYAMFVNHPTEPTSLSLNDVVREIVEVAQPRLRESHIVLDVSLDERLPRVVADVVQMRQVVLNLIVNAADALRETSEHSRLLRISTRQGRSSAILSVRDTGKGFRAEEREQLFEPFYTTKPGGTGMGLAICRSIMLSHGGSLSAFTNAGGGATFRIRMPGTLPM